MTIDERVQQAGAACDERFDRSQPALIATLRAHGVTDDEMPDVLNYAFDEYERQRGAALDELRTLLERIEQLHATNKRLEAERTPIAPPA